jgi:cytosine/uracil/thiamine/allantoin permease
MDRDVSTKDIFHRLRVGLSLVVGFLLGKFLAEQFPHHASEFFSGGFLLGVILTQAVYWVIETLSGDRSS